MSVLENPWIILALPLFSFLAVGLFVRPKSDRWAGILGTFSVFSSMVCSYLLAIRFLHLGLETSQVPWSFEWLRFMDGLVVSFGVLLDPISVMMLTVVTTVSFLVHVYSMGYMKGESGYGRYFTYLSLFTFSMLGLVVAPNILQMYVFWELVGVSSFLLIGFYYEKPSAVSASKKAFIVTRFADLGFLIGILLIGFFGFQIQGALGGIVEGQPLDFSFLTNPIILEKLSETGILTAALVLIFIGAAGKSAMFPLHIWLPDAMEGPTPVSALIHAATMVVAGVYLVARMFPVFAEAPAALDVVAYVGLFTCAFAAIIACTQDDIKRVLAFSTLSQLGYMMFALGISSLTSPLGFSASMFHLYTHAFFKALLFLGAGSVIHAVHTNNVWEMGGLKKKMPITHITFLIAVLAISGIWPFAGFFSKDEILSAALEGQRNFHFFGGLAVAGITAFYMARIYFLTFWGEARKDSHAHESGPAILFPLIVLAVLSCVAGFFPLPELVNIGLPLSHHGTDLRVAIPGTVVAVLGLFVAWMIYGKGSAERSDNIAARLGAIYRTIRNKFYFDELYLFVTHRIIFHFIARPIAWFDRAVVDGTVNLTGSATRFVGRRLTLIQTGQLQAYGSWFVLGATVTSILYWLVAH